MKAPLNVAVGMAINFQLDENALVSMSGIGFVLIMLPSLL